MKEFNELRTILDNINAPDEALRLLSEIEGDWKEGEVMLKDANSRVEELEDDIEGMYTSSEYAELEEQIEELEKGNAPHKDVLLEAMADSRNWNGNTFLPPEAKFAIWSPDQLANKVLRGDTI